MVHLGIVGGFGPEATSWVYTRVTRALRDVAPCYPQTTIINPPLRRDVEQAFVAGRPEDAYVEYLVELVASTVVRLTEAGAEHVLLPCNTLHLYLEDIAWAAGQDAAPVLDMTALAAARLAEVHAGRVLVLGTGTTVGAELYRSRLDADVELRHLPPGPQAELQELIQHAIAHGSGSVASTLSRLVRRHGHGCDAVLLACTDLCTFDESLQLDVPVVNSLEALADGATALVAAGWSSTRAA